jgi:hypothetical protein
VARLQLYAHHAEGALAPETERALRKVALTFTSVLTETEDSLSGRDMRSGADEDRSRDPAFT